MNTFLEDRLNFKNLPDGELTAYCLLYDCKEFYTVDKAEISIKILELISDNDHASFSYIKYKTTKAGFLKQLQEVI